MELKTFYDNFEVMAEAHDGIQKLREMILQLAIQGKLVPQVQDEGTGNALLEAILQTKEKLIESGQIKKPKKLPLIDESEWPFELPASWCWCRLGDTTNYSYALKVDPKNIDADIWVLELEDVEKITSRLLKRVTNRERQTRSTKTVFRAGDVVYGKLRPYLDKVIVADQDGVCTTEMIPISGYHGIQPEYLRWVLKSPYFIEYANQSTHGMNLPRLGTDKARLAIMPLPAEAEQKRIVAKVDELMALCDDLEARKQKAHHTCIQLNDSSISKLLTAPTPAKFSRHWRCIADNFDLLYGKPENVTKLRQAILQLAVQGKLVKQDQKDEPASVLLGKIQATKTELTKKKMLQKDKKLSPLSKEHPPWSLPPTWRWVRLQEILEITRGGSPRPAGDPMYFGGATPWITVKEITKDDEIYLTNTQDGLTEEGTKRSRFVEIGDMLLTNSGATLGVPKISKIRGCINDGVALLKQFHSGLNQIYLYYFLLQQTPAFRSVNQGMGQPNLNTPIIAGWFFPLPPLTEQNRIVDKIEQMIALCDDLEVKLIKGQAKCGKLLEAAVADLLAA